MCRRPLRLKPGGLQRPRNSDKCNLSLDGMETSHHAHTESTQSDDSVGSEDRNDDPLLGSEPKMGVCVLRNFQKTELCANLMDGQSARNTTTRGRCSQMEAHRNSEAYLLMRVFTRLINLTRDLRWLNPMDFDCTIGKLL